MDQKEKLIEILQLAPRKYMSYDEYADYLLKNGVIVPPCKVGDVVYPLYADRRFRAFIEQITITTNDIFFEWAQYDVGVDCTETWDDGIFRVDDIGKTVFLDESEYLKALAERNEE